jgi:hypothetical protein
MSAHTARRHRSLVASFVALGLLLSTIPARVMAVPGGAPVASGVLRNAGGDPMAGTVALWYQDPDRGELVLAASTNVGPDGRYQLRTNAGSLRRLAAQNGGWLNLLVAGGSEATQGSVAITRRLAGGAWSGPNGELAKDIVAAEPLTAAERPAARAFAASAAEPSTAVVRARSIGTCWSDLIATWSGYTIIGELHTWTDETATWTYGRTADSDIGVGISYDGKAWKQTGSFHVGSTNASSVTKSAGSRYGRLLASKFQFKKYQLIGYCPFLPNYEITPTRWLSGLVEGAYVRNYDGYCGSYYKAHATEFGRNTSWTRDDKAYATFSAAVTAFGVVSLTARSGLSTNVKMTHTFGSAYAPHRLCGNDNDILRAHRVFAG